MEHPSTIRAIVSSELRTPLTVIRMGVDLLASDRVDAGSRQSILDAVTRAERRLEEIVAVSESIADGWVVDVPDVAELPKTMPAAALAAAHRPHLESA